MQVLEEQYKLLRRQEVGKPTVPQRTVTSNKQLSLNLNPQQGRFEYTTEAFLYCVAHLEVCGEFTEGFMIILQDIYTVV